jgi:hypothetical protein
MRRQPARLRLMLLLLTAASAAFLLAPGPHVLTVRCYLLSALRPALAFLKPSTGAPAMMHATAGDGGAGTGGNGIAGPDGAGGIALRAEVIRLREEVRRLRARLYAASVPQGSFAPRGVAASVIARGAFWDELVLGLDRGTRDGVRAETGLLFYGVAVGRIVAAGPSTSCAALTVHRGVRVAARLADCRAEGVLRGTGHSAAASACVMSIFAADLQARPGEHVVTSGLDGSFPPGCWLGDVVSVEQKSNLEWELAVQPPYEAARLEAVHVLTEAPPEIPWPAATGGRRR